MNSDKEPKPIEVADQLPLISKLGRVSLQQLCIEDWWYEKDNLEVPRYGVEMIEDF